MNIKLTLRDGYWYLDIKQSPCAAFTPHSRYPSIPQALEAAEKIMKWEETHAKH